jgi:hypothetical protein
MVQFHDQYLVAELVPCDCYVSSRLATPLLPTARCRINTLTLISNSFGFSVSKNSPHLFRIPLPPDTPTLTMVSSKSIAFFLSLAISATALATPHDIQNAHRRHALTPRVPIAAPDPAAVADVEPFPQVVRKRSLGKRCKHRPAPSPSPTKHSTPPSPPPSPLAGVANAGSNPDTPSPSPTVQEKPTNTNSAPQSTAGLPSYMIGTQSGQGKSPYLLPDIEPP